MTFMNAAMIGRLPGHTRLSALALTAALGLAGCSVTSARLASPGQDSVKPSRPVGGAVPAVARCTSAMLRIQAGREGVNVGSRPCILRGPPLVAILQSDGKPLPVRSMLGPNAALSPVLLRPGKLDAAGLVVYWANWCGRSPGPLSVRVTLQDGGVVTGSFNGPPDYNLVPPCLKRGQPSTISVIDAYGPGFAG
jgi:hypothetical protein